MIIEQDFLNRRKIMGSAPNRVYQWLSISATQVIKSTFGTQDGQKIINATINYLNNLDPIDIYKRKAREFASYINEDPLMVCSLGLNIQDVNIPIRTLNSSGGAYIDTGIAANSNTVINLRIDIYGKTYKTDSAGWDIDGIGGSTGVALYVGISNSNLAYGSQYNGANRNTVTGIYVGYGEHKHLYVDYKNKIVGCDSNSISFDMEATPDNTAKFFLFGWTSASGPRPHNADKSRATYKINNEYVRDYIPCKHTVNGVLQCGMLDTINMVWYGNANSTGTFTIPDIIYEPTI